MAQKYFDKDRLKRANPGEQLAFDWLADALPESYIVWHEPRVDGWKPDLVVFGAQIGLVILEVKDWSPNAIRGVDERGRVLKAEGEESETHPLIQAEGAAQTIARRLEREPACRQSTGSYRGTLAFPWACGGVLPNFRASQVTGFGLDRRHAEGAIITGEEIGGRLAWALSGDRLVKRLSRLKKIDFKWQITPPMKESLCRLLSPPTVIARSYAGLPRESDAAQRMLALEHTSLFTSEQEQVARNLGDGFQVLQGVVGSGKSEVVAARARILAEAHRGWRILVLCYNVSLASWLRPRVFESGAIQGHDVTVAHFHDWCRELLDRSGISFGAEVYSSETKPNEAFAELTRDALRDGRITRRYHAILVDEAQDFSAVMLEACQAALEPSNASLLLATDNAQRIYAAVEPPLKRLGISARGRTEVLKVNHRSSREINTFSRRFLFGEAPEGTSISVRGGQLFVPYSADRSSKGVEVRQCRDIQSEVQEVARWCLDLLEKGYIPDEIAVLYGRRRVSLLGAPLRDRAAVTAGRNVGADDGGGDGVDLIELLQARCRELQVPIHWLARDSRTKADATVLCGKVQLSTIHSFKGLEAHAVAIVGADLQRAEIDADPLTKALYYVGMTRATDRLLVTWSNPAGFGRDLGPLIAA